MITLVFDASLSLEEGIRLKVEIAQRTLGDLWGEVHALRMLSEL